MIATFGSFSLFSLNKIAKNPTTTKSRPRHCGDMYRLAEEAHIIIIIIMTR